MAVDQSFTNQLLSFYWNPPDLSTTPIYLEFCAVRQRNPRPLLYGEPNFCYSNELLKGFVLP